MLSERGTMLRMIAVIGLAGLTSLTVWSQSTGNTPERSPNSANAAERGSKNFYQLNFLLRELENDRLINSRAYSIILSSHNDRGAIRAGEKVPFSSTSGAKTEWQQIDVGVNIDCAELEQLGDRIALNISAEISSVLEHPRRQQSSAFSAYHSKQPLALDCSIAAQAANDSVLIGRSSIEAEDATAIDGGQDPIGLQKRWLSARDLLDEFHRRSAQPEPPNPN